MAAEGWNAWIFNTVIVFLCVMTCSLHAVYYSDELKLTIVQLRTPIAKVCCTLNITSLLDYV